VLKSVKNFLLSNFFITLALYFNQMRIPRKRIQKAHNLISKLKSIKYVHFRDVYKEIDHTNFQTGTKTDFKKIPIIHNAHCTWDKLSKEFADSIILKYKSKTNSKYFILKNGDVYRLSNHWGAVSSCEWTLDGKGELRCSVFVTGEWEIGVSNLKHFSTFRRNQVRRCDIIINPEWEKQMIPVILIKDELYKLKTKYIFDFIPVEDKKLIGKSYYTICKELNFPPR